MQTALEKLAELDAWFATHPDCKETGKLWNILTAMRGPDEDTAQKKKPETTCVLRSVAFPKLARREMTARADWLSGESYVRAHFEPVANGVTLPHNPDSTQFEGYWGLNHFDTHVKLACDALGITPAVPLSTQELP